MKIAFPIPTALIWRFSMIYGSDKVPVPAQRFEEIKEASCESLSTWIVGLETKVRADNVASPVRVAIAPEDAKIEAIIDIDTITSKALLIKTTRFIAFPQPENQTLRPLSAYNGNSGKPVRSLWPRFGHRPTVL